MAFTNVQSDEGLTEDRGSRAPGTEPLVSCQDSTQFGKVFLKSFELCKNHDEWWKNGVVYEVYVRSFCDSNGDGIGDLNGITSKLDYFVNLGVTTLWLTPFYTSPMVDFGYDVSNYIDIDPIFGTLDDFKNLLIAMKEKGLKLIVDFVPNHTSDQHEWFRKSIMKEEPYTNYYVWKPAKNIDSSGNPVPPNNWQSIFGGSAWEYNPTRREFYLHQFAKEQPDLNYRDKNVIREMIQVLDFWLGLGVDGLRVDAAPHLLEDFREDSNGSGNCKTNVPGTLEIIEKFRKVCDRWTAKTEQERVLMTEGYLDIEAIMDYYGTEKSRIANISLNFSLLGLNNRSSGYNVYKTIEKWFEHLPKYSWSNWQIGNHDQPRAGDRFGSESIDMLNMINLLLPGTALTYYGEELGMLNTFISPEQTVDPWGKGEDVENSRDPERTPMQWNAERNAGFTEGPSTWLPINQNYGTINVEAESASATSHLKVYKELVEARKLDAWKYGNFELDCLNEKAVFAFARYDANKSKSGLLVVTNFSNKKVQVDASCFQTVPKRVSILTKSVHASSLSKKSSFVDTKSIPLDARTGAVFIWDSDLTYSINKYRPLERKRCLLI